VLPPSAVHAGAAAGAGQLLGLLGARQPGLERAPPATPLQPWGDTALERALAELQRRREELKRTRAPRLTPELRARCRSMY
jgi:hypothetical protein